MTVPAGASPPAAPHATPPQEGVGAQGGADALFVLGAGRAGLGIARAVRAAGGTLTGVHGRHAIPGELPVSAGSIPLGVADASIVLVAVQDRALDAALGELLAAPLRPGAVVLQASGSVDPAGFAALRAVGHPCGTFHPLVPLARPELAPVLLRGAWIGVDGDPAAEAAARRLAARVGAHALRIPPGEKGRYHAAAVFASNFPIVLAALAERLLADAGVARAEARPAIRHLLSSAAENLARGDDAALALTGPVVRGDAETVRRHLQAIPAGSDELAAYRALARATLDVARAAGADAAVLTQIESMLE